MINTYVVITGKYCNYNKLSSRLLTSSGLRGHFRIVKKANL
jgi:hypothetical protein